MHGGLIVCNNMNKLVGIMPMNNFSSKNITCENSTWREHVKYILRKLNYYTALLPNNESPAIQILSFYKIQSLFYFFHCYAKLKTIEMDNCGRGALEFLKTKFRKQTIKYILLYDWINQKIIFENNFLNHRFL